MYNHHLLFLVLQYAVKQSITATRLIRQPIFISWFIERSAYNKFSIVGSKENETILVVGT